MPMGAVPRRPLFIQYVYNSAGQLVQTIDSLGRVTEYQYDSLGRRSKII